jgi:DNA-binding transcriptional regulator YiaG
MWDAAQIKKLRQRLGITQEALAHRLGVTLVTVNRWENGHVKPTGLSVAMLDGVEKQLEKKGNGK